MADEIGMVEKVAKAICAAQRMDNYDSLPEGGAFKADYRAAARAAISAMREPTEAMIDQASRMRVHVKEYRGKNFAVIRLAAYASPEIMAADRIGMAEAHRAAITAALSEDKP